jgi:hypothetical protein
MNFVFQSLQNVRIFYLMHKLFIKIFSFLSMVIFSSAVSAQELKLFEETESNNVNVGDNSPSAVRRDRDGNILTGPEFTLIGTTRIGANSLIVVKDRLGDTISVSIPKGASASIPTYPGFQVVDVGAGDAVIKFPNSLSCVEFRNLGVSCEASDLARLVLTNAKPLERRIGDATLSDESSVDTVLQGEVDQENVTNPFEALLERAASSNSEVDTSAFEPMRINPEDIPPGMRVVSTPFGDRLVEEE